MDKIMIRASRQSVMISVPNSPDGLLLAGATLLLAGLALKAISKL